MIVTILQSGYIPWIGFFHMMDLSSKFVIYDHVQWTKNDWRNRNRIRTPKGWEWLTVPVKGHENLRVCEVDIDYSKNWQKDHLRTLEMNYKRTPYFKEIYELLEDPILVNPKLLVELNYPIIRNINKYLGIKTKILYSQDMNLPLIEDKTDMLLYELKMLKAGTYLTGPLAEGYLKVEKLEREGIQVWWHKYQYPYYTQLPWNSNIFLTHLSIIDLLFNHGKESLDILTHRKEIENPAEIQIEWLGV